MEEILHYLQSPRKQLDEEAQEIPANCSAWDGRGTWMPLRLMVRFGGETELRLTEEQKQRLPFLYKENELGREWFEKMYQNPTPEFTQAQQAVHATLIPGDPYFERATEEQKNAYREANATVISLWLTAMQADIQDTLTPEQMLQVRKLEMQLMPEVGIPFPSMFETLGLTDEQKREMNKISDDLKAEFNTLTQEAAALKAERIVASFGLLKGKSFTSQEELFKAFSDTFARYVPSEEARKKSDDIQKRGQKLVTTLQSRLMNVLTDDQLDKMQKIMDETPETIKRFIAQSKAQREQQKKSPMYVPGPDSWRPGDPVPVQFKEERQKTRQRPGFSRGEGE